MPNGGFEITFKAAVFFFKKLNHGGCIKVTHFKGHDDICGGIVMSISFSLLSRQLKKAHHHYGGVVRINTNQ